MKTRNPYRRYFPAWHELAEMSLEISVNPFNLTAEEFATTYVYPWYAHNGKPFRIYRVGEYRAFVVPLTRPAVKRIMEDQDDGESAAMVFDQNGRLRPEMRGPVKPRAWMHVERIEMNEPGSRIKPPGNLDISWIDAITARRLAETYTPLSLLVTIDARKHGAAWSRLGFTEHPLFDEWCVYSLHSMSRDLPDIDDTCREHQSTIPKLRR